MNAGFGFKVCVRSKNCWLLDICCQTDKQFYSWWCKCKIFLDIPRAIDNSEQLAAVGSGHGCKYFPKSLNNSFAKYPRPDPTGSLSLYFEPPPPHSDNHLHFLLQQILNQKAPSLPILCPLPHSFNDDSCGDIALWVSWLILAI